MSTSSCSDGKMQPAARLRTPPPVKSSRDRQPEGSVRYAIDPTASLDLLGGNIQPKLFLQGARDGTAHSVRLPLEFLHDLLDSSPVWTFEHFDQLGLLAVGPRARLVVL